MRLFSTMNRGKLPGFGLVYLIFLCCFSVSAQDTGPELLCTRSEAGGDILNWTNTTPSCGTFVATVIYRSPQREGPYTVVDSIEDISIAEYRDGNPTGQRNFYYLEYVTDCPASPPLLSDTLDNFIPETPPLNFISVEDGDLVLVWEPSASPEVSGYLVFEVRGGLPIVIDSVMDATTYRVTGVPADELTSRQYRISAFDPCGNDSPLGRIASATGLTGSGGEACDATIALTTVNTATSTIMGTPDGPPELFVSVDGGPFTQVEYTLQPPLTVLYSLGNDGETLCFYLQAGILEREDSARSDTFCTTLSINQPARPFDLYGLELADDGDFRIFFDNTQLQPSLTSFEVTVRRANGVEAYVDTVNDLFLGDRLSIDSDRPIEPGDSVTISITDDCDRTVTTNAAQPVFLTAASATDGNALLNWSPLVNGLAGTLSYDVLRYVDGLAAEVIGSTADGVLSFTDVAADAGGACYRIRANFTPADRDTTYEFLSNESCVLGQSEVYFPNIFTPNANQPANRTFRPLFSSPAAVRSYRFRVFDRWGGLYFDSENPTEGWRGGRNGKFAPTGSYIYTLTYGTGDGNLRQLTGVVVLTR